MAEADSDAAVPAMTDAELADVIRIQSLFRGHQGREAAQRKRQEREQAAIARQNLPEITMPDESESGYVATVTQPAPATNGSLPQSKKPKGVFSSVDISTSTLKVNELSVDARGVQTVYTRMLKTHNWM